MITPGMRGNADWAIFTRDISIDNRTKFYKMYGALCKEGGQRLWNAIFSAATTEHTVLVIHVSNTKSNNLEDCFYWYRAPWPLPKWKLGDKEYRNYHLQRLKAIHENKPIPKYRFSYLAGPEPVIATVVRPFVPIVPAKKIEKPKTTTTNNKKPIETKKPPLKSILKKTTTPTKKKFVKPFKPITTKSILKK